MTRPKRKPPKKQARPATRARHSLELKVTARPDGRRSRDVYLCERAGKSGARSMLLYHADAPLPTVHQVCEWARLIGIPILQDPPGNLGEDV